MGNYFTYDTLITNNEMCSMQKYVDIMWTHLQNYRNIKLLGRRNFGKTSLLKNILLPKWLEEKKERGLSIYCDLYSVQTMEDLAHELALGLTLALKKRETNSEKLLALFKEIKNIKPIVQVDEMGVELSLKHVKGDKAPPLKETFIAIETIIKNEKLDLLLVLDEFQEIASIPKAQSLLRSLFEELPKNRSIVVLGSKAHLLQKIFSAPKAPLYQWGHFLEIREFEVEDYHQFILRQLSPGKFSLDLETSHFFQKHLHFEPEAINKFFDYAATLPSAPKNLSKEYLLRAYELYLEEMRGVYSELLTRYSTNERRFLIALAKTPMVENITGKVFGQALGALSREGIRKIFSRLMDQGVVIKLHDYYIVNDPYFEAYLKKYQ